MQENSSAVHNPIIINIFALTDHNYPKPLCPWIKIQQNLIQWILKISTLIEPWVSCSQQEKAKSIQFLCIDTQVHVHLIHLFFLQNT